MIMKGGRRLVAGGGWSIITWVGNQYSRFLSNPVINWTLEKDLKTLGLIR